MDAVAALTSMKQVSQRGPLPTIEEEPPAAKGCKERGRSASARRGREKGAQEEERGKSSRSRGTKNGEPAHAGSNAGGSRQ